jgi:hypothetical protein
MGRPGPDSSGTHFLNVDLEIHSKADLTALVTALGAKVLVLYTGRVKRTYCAYLELARIRRDPTADATIRGFCALIEALAKPERNLWDAARSRDFSIGVQAGTHPPTTDFALEAGTLKAVSRLGGRIVLTVYAPGPAIAVNG